ncbi:MAG: oligopeptide transporter, OPT family [Paludibacter sp.]|nr:oligopeptide transporter, OPT family [Paludibacter sp.]
MSESEEKVIGLPENATRELKSGEEYHPIMSSNKVYPEVNVRSVSWGIVMAILFSAAAAYLGLKIGQVFEAAIPIAIIAVGLSSATKRKNALGENVIIQSIGACSGVIVAGAIFTLPAIYILQAKYPDISVDFYQVFLASLFGGILGILFMIPFRKYFVKDMHGKYPFPEATATTQVLVSGEKGGSQAKPLIIAGLIGGIYDFLIATFGTWAETFTSKVLPFGEHVYEKAKVLFSINVGAAVLGLGYIVGLKYAFIMTVGSALIWFVVVPLLPAISDVNLHFINPLYNFAQYGSVADMNAEMLFKLFARHIGIGAIAVAGLIGVIKSWNVIKTAVGLASNEMKGKGAKVEKVKVARTQRDLAMKIIVFGIIIALLVTFVFFWLGVVHNLLYAVIGIFIVAIIAFLFTTVAATAIATVGTNPVSGMTLMTLIIASVILVAVGLKGSVGIVAAMIIGGVVCTALSMAGGFITDLKIGYWLGTTPAKQQTWKFLGTLVSAATVGGVMIILNKTYGFGEGGLVAPQANAMAALIDPLMNGTGAPWLLYGIGALISIVLTLCRIPALAFALGMFIPFDLNVPLLVGGLIAWYVSSRSKDAALNTVRKEKGTLIASGFIAGGALMGVVSAIIKFGQNTLAENKIKEFGQWVAPDLKNEIKESFSWVIPHWADSFWGQWVSLLAYAILICFFIWYAMKAKKEV